MDKILRIGMVGLGIAATAMIPSFIKHPNIRISAAVARNSTNELKQFANDFNADIFESVESLCKSNTVDAVYIATPTQLHKEHVITAAENGKHILVEKPIAISLRDTLEMIDIVEKNGVKMIVGHSHSFDPPVQKIREIISSGKLGRLRMIHNWYYNDWIYRPRLPEELDTNQGGGVTFRQGSHQFDIIRLLGGGKIRSVRATTGIWDQNRPTEGSHTAFLQFEDDIVATAVYNGYDYFHTSELTFAVGEDGQNLTNRNYGKARKVATQPGNSLEKEEKLKRSYGYGGLQSGFLTQTGENQPFYGLTVVSCEKGDIRQSPRGLFIYGEEDKFEVILPEDKTGRDMVVEELYEGIINGKPIIHNGRWGLANLEVCSAVIESSKQQKEIYLKHQVSIDYQNVRV